MSHPAESADRLGVTVLFSLILHGVLVLGLGFDFPKPRPMLPSLDVILVQSANAEDPEKADFLAQVANRGGGTSDTPGKPAERVSSLQPKPEPGEAAQPLAPSAPEPIEAHGPEILTAAHAPQAAESQRDQREQRPRDLARSPEEIERELEMARLAAEVAREQQVYAKRPRPKFLSANTREYAYAAYMANWVERVQRIGNLNYPEEARRRALHGQLILTVVLDRDGKVKRIEVIQSSGHRVLDDAAVRIVEQAAPFPAVPQKGDEFDEFNITRTWQFLPGDTLSTSG